MPRKSETKMSKKVDTALVISDIIECKAESNTEDKNETTVMFANMTHLPRTCVNLIIRCCKLARVCIKLTNLPFNGSLKYLKIRNGQIAQGDTN